MDIVEARRFVFEIMARLAHPHASVDDLIGNSEKIAQWLLKGPVVNSEEYGWARRRDADASAFHKARMSGETL